MHVADTSESQPSPVNPADQRRLEEHDRLLNLKAKVREKNLRRREQEADNVNSILREKVENAKSSYDTAQFSEEYTMRKRYTEFIKKASKTTAESFVLGGSGRLGGLHSTVGGGSKNKNLSHLAKSCPDFTTNSVGTSGRGANGTRTPLSNIDDQLFNGQYLSDILDDETLLVGGKLSRPRSSPGIRRPKQSQEPQYKNKKNNKNKRGQNATDTPNSPEMLRSMTEERLKDIERVERVLRGLKNEDHSDAALQPQQLFANDSKPTTCGSSKNLSDLSGDDQQESRPSTPLEATRLPCAAFNPLLKLKLRASRIRKINVYMRNLQTSLEEDESNAKSQAEHVLPSELQQSHSGKCLLPSSAVWTIKLKRQRIRKINKYLSNLQNSFGPGGEHGDDDMTEEEMEELEKILADMPNEPQLSLNDVTTGLPRDLGSASSNDMTSRDTNSLGRVRISYGGSVKWLDGYSKNDCSAPVEDFPGDNVSRVRELMGADKMYTEFGIPTDQSLLPPTRNDSNFVMCGDTSRVGSLPRDVYKIGIPRCCVLTECGIECKIGDTSGLESDEDSMEAITSVADYSYSLRISDVGLGYSKELLTSVNGPSKRFHKNHDQILCSTGLLIELIGPAELQTMVGASKVTPWECSRIPLIPSGQLYHEHVSSISPVKKPSDRCNKSPVKSGSGAPCSPAPVRKDEYSRRTVISRHFLSVNQLHAMAGCQFSSALHNRLGKLKLFDNLCSSGGTSYGYDATNLPAFISPGMLFECLSTYLDTMGKGLLLEMILSHFEPTVSVIDASAHSPLGLGNVQYLNSSNERASGIAVRSDAVMKRNEMLRIGVFLSFS